MTAECSTQSRKCPDDVGERCKSWWRAEAEVDSVVDIDPKKNLEFWGISNARSPVLPLIIDQHDQQRMGLDVEVGLQISGNHILPCIELA